MVATSLPVSRKIRSATQREALPQLSTSSPELFQMRMRRSARPERSSTMSWSQPMPVFLSAMARAFAWSMARGEERASKMTKSLPNPFILRKCMAGERDIRASNGSRLIWQKTRRMPGNCCGLSPWKALQLWRICA
jgi:hypothetical protein